MRACVAFTFRIQPALEAEREAIAAFDLVLRRLLGSRQRSN
jgi:hypothetical protein